MTTTNNNKTKTPTEAVTDSLQEKLSTVIETAAMTEEELSAYCRNRGLYVKDIEIWKQELLTNVDSRNKKKLDKENSELKVKIRELQAELRCKEKALAETTALLLLKKKQKLSGRTKRKKNNKGRQAVCFPID